MFNILVVKTSLGWYHYAINIINKLLLFINEEIAIGKYYNYDKRTVIIMGDRVINNVQVNTSGDVISTEELTVYLTQLQAKSKYKIISVDITVDGDFIDVKTVMSPAPFDRIRRITGYLVGTTNRFCDAKQAEEHDRVKHG